MSAGAKSLVCCLACTTNIALQAQVQAWSRLNSQGLCIFEAQSPNLAILVNKYRYTDIPDLSGAF